jgi:hypothetical protein
MKHKWSAKYWDAKPLPDYPGCFFRILGAGYHSPYRLWAGPEEAVFYIGTYRTLHQLQLAAAGAAERAAAAAEAAA